MLACVIAGLVERYEQPLVNKNNTPRMPWHDVAIGMVRICAFIGYFIQLLVKLSTSNTVYVICSIFSYHAFILCFALLPLQVGTPARDVARHFVQRWNFIKASKGMHRVIVPFLTPKGEFVAARDDSKFKGTCRVQVIRSSSEWSSGVDREVSAIVCYANRI